MVDFGGYQYEIYLDGLRGVVPRFPMTYEGWEARAQAAMWPLWTRCRRWSRRRTGCR